MSKDESKEKSSWGGKRENSGRKSLGFSVKPVYTSVRTRHHEEFKKQVKLLLIKLYEND